MSVELLGLDVTVSGPGGLVEAAVDGFRLYYAVGDIPKAIISLHDIGGESTSMKRVFVGAEAQRLKNYQSSAFSGQTIPANLNINPIDHTFKGNIVGPNMNILSNYYNNGVTLIHPVEVVNSYTPHIYALANVVNRDSTDETLLSVARTNVFDMVAALMEKRHNDFDILFPNAQFTDETSKENIQQLHNRNLTVWPTVKKILETSSLKGGPTYAAFSDLGKGESYVINSYIFNALKSVLFNITEPFFYALISLGDMFQSYYVPPIEGDSEFGYFKSNREKVEDPLPVTLQITKLSATCSKLDNLPIQQVIVSGPAPRLTRAEIDQDQNVYDFLGDNPTYAVYPKNPPKLNGNNMQIPLPSWLPANIAPVSQGVKGPANKKPDLQKKREAEKKIGEIVKNEVIGPIQKIIEELASTTYKNVALASYVVQLSCTLDFSLIVGNRYQILDEDGVPLFSGLLQVAEHAASGISSSLSAATTLTFYAVSFADFKLPE
jgi:hypothetical protein